MSATPQTTDSTLEAKVESLASRVADLEADLETEREQRRQLEVENEELKRDLKIAESRLDALADAQEKNHSRVSELQSRELEKGAHLLYQHIEGAEDMLEVSEGRIERMTKDDGRKYARVPGEVDDLGRGGEVAVGHSDLLPIQQLARLDEDMLANENKPVQLAVKVWRERDRGDTPGSLWNSGSKGVKEYFDAGDLATEIRVWEDGVTKEYSQKLASRTIEAMQDLSKNRLVKKTRQRKTDGLTYREGRIIIPSDAEIPGETPTPETNDVGGA